MNDKQSYVVRGEPSKGDIREDERDKKRPLQLTANWIHEHFKVLPNDTVATPIGKYNHETVAVHEDSDTEVNFRSPYRVMKEAEKIAVLMDYPVNDTSVERTSSADILGSSSTNNER